MNNLIEDYDDKIEDYLKYVVNKFTKTFDFLLYNENNYDF